MAVSFRFLGCLYPSGALRRCFLFAFVLLLLSSCLLFITTAGASAMTNVSGTISQDTDWNAAGSPYVLTGSVTVSSGVTLTIEQDVVVKPQYTGTSLIINGTLNATGAIFTSSKDDVHGGDTNGDGAATSPAPGDWSNVNFATGSSGSLAGSYFLWGGWGGSIHSYAALYINTNGSVSVSNCSISHSGSAYQPYVSEGILMSPSGMVEIPRLQAKQVFV